MPTDLLPSGRWRARFRGADGRFVTATFDRKTDAVRWERRERAALDRDGDAWVDPRAGRVTFADYAARWQTGHLCSPATERKIASVLRAHLLPAFGARSIGTVRRGEVRAFVKAFADSHAPATTALVYGYLSTIFAAAVADRLLVESPCRDVTLPTIQPTRVQPLAPEQVERLIAATPDRYAALIVLAAGSGLRQGEALGLTVDRVDFLRRTLRVDRQLTSVGPLRLTERLKTPTSRREVPLPQSVVDALARHLATYPVEHPEGLLFTRPSGEPIRPTLFRESVWHPSLRRAGLPEQTGFHGLRHFYASLLIRHGESVKVVQERLGHKSATETLNTYAHLWPDSEDRTRAAVDAVLGRFGVTDVSRGAAVHGADAL